MPYPDWFTALRTSDSAPILRALLIVLPLVALAVIVGVLLPH